MSTKETQLLIRKVSDLERKLAGMTRVGTVHEVKGDKLRINMGKGADGKPVLSPWIHQNNHRGGSRERRFFKGPKQQGGQNGQGGGSEGGGGGGGGGGQGGGEGEGGGQNVTLFCPSGDPRQGIIMAYAPNENHPAPDHANKSGQDEETWQLEDNRRSTGKDGTDWWLEPPEDKKQQGGAGGGAGAGGGGGAGGEEDSKERKTGGDKAEMKMRYNAETGFTHRIKKDVRSAVHKKGAKLKAKENLVVVDKDDDRVKVKSQNKPWVSQPWEIKSFKDPIPDDDK